MRAGRRVSTFTIPLRKLLYGYRVNRDRAKMNYRSENKRVSQVNLSVISCGKANLDSGLDRM